MMYFPRFYLICFTLFGFSLAAETHTFRLPEKRAISMTKPIDCRSAGMSMISENKGKLEIVATGGTDHVVVTKNGSHISLLIHHLESPDEREEYKITVETPFYLAAIQEPKLLPGVRGMVINKRVGTAIWTLTDGEFAFVSEFPDSTSVFFECKNAGDN